MLAQIAVRRLDVPVNELVREAFSTFCCAEADDEIAQAVDEYLQARAAEDAGRHLSTTYLAFREDGGEPALAGYITLSFGSLILAEGELDEVGRPEYSTMGALRITMIGVDSRCQRQRCGEKLLYYALGLAREMRSHVSVRFLVADVNPMAVGWYEKQGFVANESKKNRRSGTQSMRLDVLKSEEMPPPLERPHTMTRLALLLGRRIVRIVKVTSWRD